MLSLWEQRINQLSRPIIHYCHFTKNMLTRAARRRDILRRKSFLAMARSLLVLLLAACATAFQAPARSTSRALRVDAFGKKAPAAPPAKDKKDMSAWDVYTEGEYGQAFKFPWEVEARHRRRARRAPTSSAPPLAPRFARAAAPPRGARPARVPQASDKTAIGHVLPIAITVGILGYARFTQGV